MQNQRTKEGVHAGAVTEDSKYTHEQMQLMKTQDASYVQLKAQVDGRVRARATPPSPPPSPLLHTHTHVASVVEKSASHEMDSVELRGQFRTDSPRSREISTKVGVDSALRNML